MNNGVVRITEMKLSHFKNIREGKIITINHHSVRKEHVLKKGDILGVYGQNGSGKTALIEAIYLLKFIFSGEPLPLEMVDQIQVGQEVCNMEFGFYIENKKGKYLVNYESRILKKPKEKGLMILYEKLIYSILEDEKWGAKSKIVEYDYNQPVILKPAHRYTQVVAGKKDVLIKLNVAKEVAKKFGTSFIFSKEAKEVFSLYKEEPWVEIISRLEHFSRYDLYVITSKQMGMINMSRLQPFCFRIKEDNKVVSGEFTIGLFEVSVVPESIFQLLLKVIKQVNTVLKTLVPGLELEVYQHGRQYAAENEMGIRIELLSVRNQQKIALRNESDGIKKIISILSALIATYNQENVCLAVDELDSGVFEYLLGEILEVMEHGTCGQLIFTSHNLRPLEKISRDSIVFTTANPDCRYMRLEIKKDSYNLRDGYLRGISLGGQKEVIYEETNTFEIEYGFRRAGREIDGD